MSFAVVKLPELTDFLYHLDSPKNTDSDKLGFVKISGWAYNKLALPFEVVINEDGKISNICLDRQRPDVSRHLLRMGINSSSDDHGFSIIVKNIGPINIGFKVGLNTKWVYKVSPKSMKIFEEATSLSNLLGKQEGVFQNVYFHLGEDWSKVIIFFNGALTAAKVSAERAPFQRWSWAKLFRHPVISIADPMTIGDNAILLAWYLGSEGPNALPGILSPIIDQIRSVNPQAEIVGFGSSGGGFAAIAAVLLGKLDKAIAINPQADALKFEVKSAVEAFQKKRNYEPCLSDLSKYDFESMKDGAKITYLQNVHDHNHFHDHYGPFRKAVQKSEREDQFKFIEYSDLKSGHMPPNLNELCKLIGDDLSALLKEEEMVGSSK